MADEGNFEPNFEPNFAPNFELMNGHFLEQ